MFCNRAFVMVFAAGFQAAALFPPSSALAAVIAPIALPPGGTVSPLPNGFSSYPGMKASPYLIMLRILILTVAFCQAR
jgi:hypothetical protein